MSEEKKVCEGGQRRGDLGEPSRRTGRSAKVQGVEGGQKRGTKQEVLAAVEGGLRKTRRSKEIGFPRLYRQ